MFENKAINTNIWYIWWWE